MRLTLTVCSQYFKRYIERELHKGKLRRQWHPLTGWKEQKKTSFYPNEFRPWTHQYKIANPITDKHIPKLYVEPIKEWNVFVGDRIIPSHCIPESQVSRHYTTTGTHSYSTSVTRYYSTTSSRSYSTSVTRSYSTSPSMSVSPGCLVGIGNPLLDITVVTEPTFLHRYGLQANNAIIAEETHLPMFDEMEKQPQVKYGAGGATQNSIRVAQWLLGTKHAATFFGCVGDDERGKILERAAGDSGLNVQYQVTRKLPTGVCGAVITGENRSLVANLGAANFFQHEELEKPESWAYIEKASVYYIGGFVFPVCAKAIFDVAKHACENNKTLAMNLSAPFLCQYYADKQLDIMPYVDVLFGNETEAAKFCELRGIKAADIKEMALETARLPKNNTSRDRIVVYTQGREPTVIATQGKVTVHPILQVNKEDIRDTNGCGDAFVGGFLAELVKGSGLAECLRCGQYAASVVIKHWGCDFPAKPHFNSTV